MVNKDLKRRILEIAYKHKLSHLGSYMSCVDAINMIFTTQAPDDIFILSNGHAALAQYVVLEKFYGIDAEMLFKKHGGHPHLDEANHIYCSTGSLGMGLPAAIGRAVANPKRLVHVMVSDGECAEGVIWESLRYINDKRISNISIYVMHNGYGAYCEIPLNLLYMRLTAFCPSQSSVMLIKDVQKATEEFPFLRGMNAHYHIMSEEDYKQGIELCQ